MIQRIQSLFLILSMLTLLSGVFFTELSITIKDSESNPEAIELSMSGFQIHMEGSEEELQRIAELPPAWPIGIVQVLIAFFVGFIILRFANRKQQIKWCTLALGLHALLLAGIIGYGYVLGEHFTNSLSSSDGTVSTSYLTVGTAAIIVSGVLVTLARSYIIKDEKLVRSVDRIR